MDGKEIQIDPVTKLGDKTINYAAMPKADYIFITYEHVDPLDTAAIKLLTSDITQLINNQRCAEMLGYGTVMCQFSTHSQAKGAVPLSLWPDGHEWHPLTTLNRWNRGEN